MHRLRIAGLTLALGCMLVINIGCLKCGENLAEKIAETATEKAVEAAGGGRVQVDGGGNVDISTLPGFLRYPGLHATGKFSMSTSEGKGTVWSLESKDAQGKVTDWYRAAFKAKGWKKGMEMETGESFMLMWTDADEKEVVTLMFLQKEGKTEISLTHVFK